MLTHMNLPWEDAPLFLCLSFSSALYHFFSWAACISQGSHLWIGDVYWFWGDKENVFCLITLGVEYSDNTVGSEQKHSSEAIIVLQAHCWSIFLKNVPVVKCWSQCGVPVRIISFWLSTVEYRSWMGHLNLMILCSAHGNTTLRIVNQMAHATTGTIWESTVYCNISTTIPAHENKA